MTFAELWHDHEMALLRGLFIMASLHSSPFFDKFERFCGPLRYKVRDEYVCKNVKVIKSAN